MNAKLRYGLAVMGLIAFLTACSPQTTTESAMTLPAKERASAVPSQVPAEETLLPIPSALPSPTEEPVEFDCGRVSEIPPAECRALVAFYRSTHGGNWKESPGWLDTDTPCYWYGVTCIGSHVTELVLFDNGLSGPLPVEIRDLTNLEVIRMMNNQLSGSLSPELGRLRKLRELDIAENQFGGEIPSQVGRLTNLIWLNLSGNDLSGAIPAELGDLQQLKWLYLGSNRLSGSIPGDLGKLRNLDGLDLSHNQLSGSIPEDLVKLAWTYWLDLSYNRLSSAVPDAWVTRSIDEAPGTISASARRLWGNQLDGTISTSMEPSTGVNFEGIYFSYPSSLADSVWPDIVAGAPATTGEAWWEAEPGHFSISFASGIPALQRYWGTWLQLPPQIRVYPVSGLKSNEITSARLEVLRELLQIKPHSPADEIPILPLINAAQVFRARVRYLNFQNGQGVRFITQYRQDAGPVVNDEIFYTFQGLTEDGTNYIVASFPVSAAILSEDMPYESQAFREFEKRNYEDYLNEIVAMLDALPSNQFEPDLALLDEIVVTLEVHDR